MSVKEAEYDVVVVGAGIVGAGVFRELALHGVKVLLLDREDFSSQTSQGSSKMLHGGIRYLENMDFFLVFEALKEKNLWLKLAPHITKEAPFYLPVYKDSKWPLFFMRIGLFIYDLLSLFKNSPHRVLNKKKTLLEIPGLKKEGLTGSGMYFDGIVDDSKLALDCIYDGLRHENASAHNYKKVQSIESHSSIHNITYKDIFTGEIQEATTKHVVMATGPFTDQVMKELNIDWEPVLLPSKGTHLWLSKESLPIKEAMVLQTKDQRIIFVIPQREAILIGTTETPLDPNENILNIKPTSEEIEYLLEAVNEYFPEAKVEKENVLSSFAAVRPLVKASSGTSSAKTSRHHKIFTPREKMHVLIGGKYTTFRKMAQDLNKKILKDLSIPFNDKLTLGELKSVSTIQDPHKKKITKEQILEIIESEKVVTKEDLIQRRLSLPSLNHIDDEELKKIIDEIDLKSSRNS